MAVITNEELRQRIADNLRISSVDRALSSERAARIDDAIADCTAELRERGLVWWADDEIPQACANGMKHYVSAHIAASVGKAGQGYETGEQFGLALLAKLKSSSNAQTLRQDYF